jgi:DUF4097 and DUF4098 domain-containing protein YvlB
MFSKTQILRALVVIATLIPPARAMAQKSDEDWIDDCRQGGADRRGRTEVYCDVHQTAARAQGGTITVEGIRNGGISLTGWNRDSMTVSTRVRVTARSQADARATASRVQTTIRGSEITVEGPRNTDDVQWTASVYAMVPQRSDIRAGTSNGPVRVTRITGDIDVTTSNGPLSLENLGGNVRARTTNGPLSITLEGTKWDGSGLEARTSNGPLTISVPEGYNARLETGTTNGPVNLGFPITVVGRVTRDISTNLGAGGATIRATTTNGPLTVRRNK